jgi:hypothetical protein
VLEPDTGRETDGETEPEQAEGKGRLHGVRPTTRSKRAHCRPVRVSAR